MCAFLHICAFCVCVCKSLCSRKCTRECLHLSLAFVHICVFVFVYMYMCMCVCMCACVWFMLVCVRIHVWLFVRLATSLINNSPFFSVKVRDCFTPVVCTLSLICRYILLQRTISSLFTQHQLYFGIDFHQRLLLGLILTKKESARSIMSLHQYKHGL